MNEIKDKIKVWWAGGKKYYTLGETKKVDGKILKIIRSHEILPLKRRMYLFFWWLGYDIKRCPILIKWLLKKSWFNITVFFAWHVRIVPNILDKLPIRVPEKSLIPLAKGCINRYNKLTEELNKEAIEQKLEVRYKKLKIEEE